jgi:diguanylate cyclase (GGDEF)-like protein/PAS domain S-box-containing protein
MLKLEQAIPSRRSFANPRGGSQVKTRSPISKSSPRALEDGDHVARLLATIELLRAEAEGNLRAEQDLQSERGLLRAMIDQVPDQLFVKDAEGRFLIANYAVAKDKNFEESGEPVTAAALIGKTDFDLFPHEIAQHFRDIEVEVMQSGQSMIDMLERNVDRAGNSKWLSMSKVPLRDVNGAVVGLLGVGRDVTARKLAEDQVDFLAHHDALTGLPNRVLLVDRLAQAILYAQRNDRRVTVVYVDLDDFKLVNDSLGHEAGDTLLRAVADRMTACVRDTDSVVRLGGDEFVVLLTDQPHGGDATSRSVGAIRATIAEPILIAGQALQVTCSMGLATFPQDGEDAEALLRNADAAMYHAKTLGRDNIQSYTVSMTANVSERLSMREEMRAGLARAEFFLLYQPQVDLRSGQILAVEALVRWNHPTLGPISPARFIPLAEESGLIVPLGDWVLYEACRQNKAWQDAGVSPVRVCVNVSARQFRDRGWIERVKHALARSGLEARYLELELTESLLMHDVDEAIATMKELQAIGVQFAIDDFGTGYSSLTALKNFPVARLKIDQSFIRSLPQDPDDRGIAAAVISLGQRLNMRVIAEGVETTEQLAFLRDNHCDEIQGYHFSRPIAAAAIEDLLREAPRIDAGTAPKAPISGDQSSGWGKGL